MSSSGDGEEGDLHTETPAATTISDPATSPAPVRAKRGRPLSRTLEVHKDLIVKLFLEDKLPIIDITRHMNLTYGLDTCVRTISRRLSTWKIPRTRRAPPSQELRDLIKVHYNNNLNDQQIAQELKKDGFDLKIRRLARLRQKLDLKRRTRYPEYRETALSDEDDEEGDSPEAATESGVPTQPRKTQAPPKKKKMQNSRNATLIPKVTAFVQEYMSKYDGSHDFNHIKRVVGLAHLIYKRLKEDTPSYVEGLDLYAITLAALLHDVGDKKYLEPGQDPNTLVLATLLSFGAPEDLAIKVQRIVVGVSYSSEIKDPEQVQAMIQKYPELAIVQDADRLDAIGAVGIGRTFTFGGAKGGRPMGETIQHFDDKLEKLESMMKTEPGRILARERTERLKTFKRWWEEEEKESREYFAED